ncbi:MAG: hypothetical protein ACJ790_02550 [Myxococcaceae bacterium]
MRLTVVCALLVATAANAQVFAEPVPGAIAPPTAPSKTTLDGVVVTSVTVVSKKSAADLQAHFTELFAKNGLYLADEVRDVELPNALQVTGLDADNMVSYTVMMQPSKKGFTTVILSSAELAKKPQPATVSFAPVMPNAAGMATAQLEGMQTLSYEVQATPAEIKAFYRSELAKMGYREVEELGFQKGADRLTLNVSPGLSSRGVFIVKETATRPLAGNADGGP